MTRCWCFDTGFSRLLARTGVRVGAEPPLAPPLTFQSERLAVEQYEGAARLAVPVAQCGDEDLAGAQTV